MSGEPTTLETANPEARGSNISRLAQLLEKSNSLPSVVEGFEIKVEANDYPAHFKRDESKPPEQWEVSDWYAGHRITLQRGELSIVIDDKGPGGSNCQIRVKDPTIDFDLRDEDNRMQSDDFYLNLDNTLDGIASHLEHHRRSIAVKENASKYNYSLEKVPEEEAETRKRLARLLSV